MVTRIYHSLYYMIMGAISFASCNQAPPAQKEKTVRIVYTDWSESNAITHLAAVLLEEEMGFSVELKLTDVENAYAEVASGTADIFADAWLPETHKRYAEKHEGKFERIGITFPEARTGFLVPAFSKMQTISDLRNYPSRIVGIDPGAGVMQKAATALNQYNLSVQLVSTTEAEMIKQFEDSVKRRKEIVITGWSPHWVFTRYDVRFLEDPDGIFGSKEYIYTIARTGFEDSHPLAMRFFERMQLNAKQLNSLVNQVRNTDDPGEGVRSWIKENEPVVNQWVKNLKPQRVKVM